MASGPAGESSIGACSGVGGHGEGCERGEKGECREFHFEWRAGRKRTENRKNTGTGVRSLEVSFPVVLMSWRAAEQIHCMLAAVLICISAGASMMNYSQSTRPSETITWTVDAGVSEEMLSALCRRARDGGLSTKPTSWWWQSMHDADDKECVVQPVALRGSPLPRVSRSDDQVVVRRVALLPPPDQSTAVCEASIGGRRKARVSGAAWTMVVSLDHRSMRPFLHCRWN